MNEPPRINTFLIIVLMVALYLLDAIIGDVIGAQITNTVWGKSFVDETPYIITIISGILDIAAFYLLFRNRIITARRNSMKIDAEVFFLTILGIAFFSSSAFALSQIIPLQESAWESVSNVKLWMQIASLVLIGPISEEIVFRGAVFGALRDNNNFFLSAALASFLFALAHGLGVAAINAFGIGMFLCLAYEKCESLLVGIAVHMTNNCFAILSSGSAGADPPESEIGQIASVAAFFLLSVYIFTQIYQLDRAAELKDEAEEQ